MSNEKNSSGSAERRLWRRCIYAAMLVSSLAAAQPAHLPRVGLLGQRSGWEEASTTPFIHGFLEGMREHGYVEGRDYIVEYRTTRGDLARYGPLAAELVRLPVDVLLVAVCGEPLNAARRATADLPIVVATCNDDMVETGIVKSLRRPGGNVTGLSKLTRELAPKRLSLLKQTVPSISRVAVLWDPGYSDFTADWRELNTAAQSMGITLSSFEFRGADEIEVVFDAMRQQHLDALITFSDVLTYQFASRVAELASAARLPGTMRSGRFPTLAGSCPTARASPICGAARPTTS